MDVDCLYEGFIKFMKYNVGDKVRIVSSWNGNTNENCAGAMDHWLGKVMTVKGYEGNLCLMKEDERENFGDGWRWNEACIAGLASDAQPDKEESNQIVHVSDASILSASFLRELLSCFKNPVISFNMMISNGSDEDQHES